MGDFSKMIFGFCGELCLEDVSRVLLWNSGLERQMVFEKRKVFIELAGPID